MALNSDCTDDETIKKFLMFRRIKVFYYKMQRNCTCPKFAFATILRIGNQEKKYISESWIEVHSAQSFTQCTEPGHFFAVFTNSYWNDTLNIYIWTNRLNYSYTLSFTVYKHSTWNSLVSSQMRCFLYFLSVVLAGFLILPINFYQ